MTAHVVYEFEIPDSQYALGFADGEKALSVSALINNAAPRTSFYLARTIVMAGGIYTLKINACDPFTFAIGEELNATRRVISAAPQSGFPYEADFYVRGGLQRIDISLFNVFQGSGTAMPSSCYVAFSLWRDGKAVYVSTADGWLVDTALIDDGSLSSAGDPRLQMPVWTTSPNWQGGVLERLGWLTEIFDSETDTEQRRSLTQNPKRSIEAQFLRDRINAERMNNFVVGVGSRKFLVPMWPEQVRIPQALAIGGHGLRFDPDDFEFREFVPGAMIMISNGDPAVYEIFVIDVGLFDDGIHVTFDPVTRAWPLGSRITPLYVARLDGLPDLSYVTDRVLTSNVRFNFDENYDGITPGWGYCAPLWRFKIDWSQPLSSTFSRSVTTMDTGIGPIDVFDYGGVSRVGQSMKLMLRGREQVVAFRAFIAMARGRTVRFWLPSQTHDIEPSGPSVSGTFFDGILTGYSDWMIDAQDARLMIAFVLSGTAPTVYRRIQYVEKFGNIDRFHLDQPLPIIARSAIIKISFVMPSRFDQDGFELNHVVDNLAVVQAAVVTKSSTIADMPPIDCWITSRPYALDAQEDMTSSSLILGGYCSTFGDEMDVGATPLSADLVTLVSYGTYDSGDDSIDAVCTSLSADLVTLVSYGTYDSGEERMGASATINSATLETLLIIHELPVEGISPSSTILGGTRT